jgi:hypothetical protein
MARAFSLEDKNLNTSSITTSRNRLYKDVDLTLAIKGNGDVYKKLDAAAVKQSIRNLILTNHGDKPFRYNYGGNLRDLLFDLADDETEFDIESTIISTVERFEPRAQIINVNAKSDPDNNSVAVTIVFNIVNTKEKVTFTTILARLR